ncbi:MULTISPECIES: DUF3900 domain-containing protein [Alteribacter]|uniref:DUF3900 domain-containing protein n=1 Tax=Alteribacter keqinensis TaxID=2483800 RepID=A0A3M7TUU5_9BACI|nr:MULTISPECIES: DUF3900 domain-containing protein [Alteribacter]MBM7094442.1 DUF3900 domain-containing protein [Alteribacter salitolerans]RNA69337.1 DUF3900 domain-containing protein [Alteribacter keqinensis]
MDFTIDFASFYVVQVSGSGEQAEKTYKHFQTLNSEQYFTSPLKEFLDGELMKIAKRKVERNPKNDQVPTKIGQFVTEPGHELDSNPNYNLFNRIRTAGSSEEFKTNSEQLVRAYTNTSAVRGGALLVIRAKLTKYMDDKFVFVLKCDFEPKVATITDEQTLIRHVEMAITTKNMKSIQYPYMPEEGMTEEWELKIHQSSHARYFEDFLKYVEYSQSMPEIVKGQMIETAHQHLAETYEPESEEWLEEEQNLEAWANTENRQLQEKWTEDQVIEASAPIIDRQPEIEMKLKLDHIDVKGLLSDFGDSIHIAKVNGKYVILIEGESFSFEKGASPVEFLQPDTLDNVLKRVGRG